MDKSPKNKSIKVSMLKIFRLVANSLFLFIVGWITIYQLLFLLHIQQYWMTVPVLLYFIAIFIIKFIVRNDANSCSIEISSVISLILFFCCIKKNSINNWFETNFESICFIIILIFFISLKITKYTCKEDKSENENKNCNQLFNLYYMNTSKTHEIAMLFDNKIIKTIEKEQVSKELLKYDTSFSFGKKDKFSSEKEDSSKKKVFESFDVKTTKSIMLNEIYKNIKNNKDKLDVGDLTIFENIELQQRNVDDTVMILNVLQDSKFKNQSNDDLEININKMMDKMLDDFTIDYTFSYSKNTENSTKYIIQIPYKSTDNFENGYQHNDLQLGKLSLIGIYRGEIDFSKRDSISSKFLDLISNPYKQQKQKNNENVGGMKLSNGNDSMNGVDFQFVHEKLEGKLNLIDVIAIIQELNIDKKDYE